ncbi:hypothetical protein ACFVAV_23325 [Nocardia sp. NPDC057663]|uniref:hypothetical protein n=1 Tax=Nocardia sp. NPDC057663 TaxID=3346201 RepID=UPI00366D8F68
MAKKTKTYSVEVFGLTKRQAETLIREALAGKYAYTVNEAETSAADNEGDDQ